MRKVPPPPKKKKKKKTIVGARYWVRENDLIEETHNAQTRIEQPCTGYTLRASVAQCKFKLFSVLYLYVLLVLSNIPAFQHRTIRKWSMRGFKRYK